MFNRAAAIGLDIGSKKIKLVRVRKTQENWQIVKFGSMLTPAGLVEAGNIFDPEKLGREMITLVDQLGFKGQKVISAVSGQQVYIRTLVMPRMSLKETKEAAVYQAATFLPVPVEEAAIDIFPLRDFEDDEGKQREIFFVAVPRIQVENLETTCRMAGLKLVAVEI
ncbi:MAG: pilus assembly protein PilM, partial [Syntrophomonas sp.]